MLSAFLIILLTAVAAPAQQNFKTLVNFNGSNGDWPASSLVQGRDGNLYGTTYYGGAYGDGTVFRMTPTGALTTLYSFNYSGIGGANPSGDFILGADGDFYGTAGQGGSSYNCVAGCGSIFKITPQGAFTPLYDFQGLSDEGNPDSLVLGSDGNFYGTTTDSGAFGLGTFFKITPEGVFTTLYIFQEGLFYPASLIQGADGNFYGTALGGANDYGAVFKVTSGGVLTTLYNFNLSDGSLPDYLIQAGDGNLYGTTLQGGTSSQGTVFKLTLAGALTTLCNFSSTSAGGHQPTMLLQATDGNFYGLNSEGLNPACQDGCGTIFRITPQGALTRLISFNNTDGDSPTGLLQATDGGFYGGTYLGGANRDGTINALSVGLGPFVETVPNSGRVGQSVAILGNGLKGSTSVTFNGIAATFTVESATSIKATVPAGNDTTGPVQVVTPDGTLTSNVSFRLIP
jgi:uncharacterized repeat protein (TIGR03803 family)